MAGIDTTPYWEKSATLPRFSALDRDLSVDVAIIGGGLTGITAGYLLKQAGFAVALLERGRCAAVDTGHTTAHLTCVTDTRLSELVRTFGRDHARAVWDAGLAAIGQIDEIVRAEQLDCHFAWTSGYLHTPLTSPASPASGNEAEELKQEAELAWDLGFDASYVERVPFVCRPGMEITGQARFNPREYLGGLLTRLDGQGSFVFEQTEVEETCAQPRYVKANGHRLNANYIIIATHDPLVGNTGIVSATLFQTKLALYTSYVIGGRVEPGRVPDALFWDTADPYHYLRVEPRRGFDYVIFGGEDHKTGQVSDTLECYARLEQKLKALLPDVEITHRWSGQVIETNDGLPYIGETASHQFAATGFAGNGMTFGTLAGMMACDAVTGRANPWRALFDTGRTKLLGGLWDYIKENKDYPYYMIRDRFAGAEGRSLRGLRRGQGKILDIEGERVAAYRAPDGAVTMRSAVCTHMGCTVEWNLAERTWDCPCHGSRFGPDGRVIAGPAEVPLSDAIAANAKAKSTAKAKTASAKAAGSSS